MHCIKLLTAASVLVFALAACSEEPAGPDAPKQFFSNLSTLCGKAFAGTRAVARDEDDMLQGDERLVVHFRECNSDQIFAAFHIEETGESSWDRSRTWVFSLHGDQVELRHDHRLPDGSEDEGNTMYGGFTEQGEGTATRQDFIFTERTGDNGEVLGWRIEVEPGERYSYGTMADGEWTWRLDFDLSRQVQTPPPAWGHEDGYAQ